MNKSSRVRHTPSKIARTARAILALSLVGVAGCGASDGTADSTPVTDQAPDTATPVAQATKVVTETAAAVVGEVDLKRGKIIFLQCRACHSLEEGGAHKVGPNLHGVIGATVGSKDGFNYSSTLSAENKPWTEDSLQAFLAKPSEYYPGTVMAFAGLSDATDRASVVAYIRSQTNP